MIYDIAIVGGGMVGAALGCMLGGAGWRLALIEARPPQPPSLVNGYDARTSALTRASERILRGADAWGAIPAARMGPFREMHVWDAGGAGAIHFDSADVGEATLGYIVENRLIQQSLEDRLSGLESVTWFRPESLEGLSFERGRVRLALNRSRIEARLVVGADGTDSRVRELVGMPVYRGDYGQQAVVATVQTAEDHRETAWQRFLDTGPLALLPLPEGNSSIVWSTTPTHAEALSAMTDAQFALALEEAFDARLGAVTGVGARAKFPLRYLHAREYVREGVVLVGDAAHTIHPLAGQGVNLGFLDAAALFEVLADARSVGRDYARRATLRRYERWRKGQNVTMGLAMSLFRTLFTNRLLAARLARNMGLSATNSLGIVKRQIIRRAMGLEGDLPRLAVGRD